MNQEEQSSKARSFKLPKIDRNKVLKWATVVAMAGGGIGLMMGGCLMWIFGEELLLITAFTSGAVFVAGAGLGFMRCLDEQKIP